ncbi:MAG: MMPL family transporter, partial [Bacillota bacterium]|nr:MMPL family transporter [Bacillota bacterium]
FINRGTNLFFGKISFVTNAAGSILQLAVSMDYSIFLLHRFLEYRQEDSDIEHAMLMAVKKSFGTVVSSGMTAVMGFTALILMKFKIGPDMGIIMAKALAISLVSVMLFFPVLALAMCKLVEKTKHKPFVPSFDKFGEIVFKVGKPMLIVFAVMLIPCYLAQQKNDFTYGQSGIYGKGTQLGNDTKRIEDIFGKSNLMVLMIPKENFSKEKEVSAELLENKNVTSVLSYAETVGVQIPEEIVPNDTLKKLVSDHYSRIVITADVPTEGESSFNLVDKIKQTAQKHFDNDYMLVGETVNTYDLKDVITSDDVKVNLLAMLSIAIILLINMKSLILPVILLAIIKLSIWINLTVPYFANEKLFYIGYLIIGSIQLGATVDYAILFADRYIENRENKLPVLAAKRTLSDTTVSILTSAGILTCAGLMLGIISSNKIISQLGILVGRGA